MLEIVLAAVTVPLLGSGVLWAGGAAALVASIPLYPGSEKYDAIVVPGARVYADGSASPALRRRVLAAAALHRGGCAPLLVISGAGRGGRTEAAVGAELAEEVGVPREALLLEERAGRTATNAAHVAELLGADASVLVVTERWHGARARLWFRRHFARVDVVGVPSPLESTVKGALREAPKVVLQTVLER